MTAGDVVVTLIDRKGRVVGTGTGLDTTIGDGEGAPLAWRGRSAILYNPRCRKSRWTAASPIGWKFPSAFARSAWTIKHGFILNDEPYDLHGVSRHQDRKGIGNAITREIMPRISPSFAESARRRCGWRTTSTTSISTTSATATA